jgi:hypothetical protein
MKIMKVLKKIGWGLFWVSIPLALSLDRLGWTGGVPVYAVSSIAVAGVATGLAADFFLRRQQQK